MGKTCKDAEQDRKKNRYTGSCKDESEKKKQGSQDALRKANQKGSERGGEAVICLVINIKVGPEDLWELDLRVLCFVFFSKESQDITEKIIGGVPVGVQFAQHVTG